MSFSFVPSGYINSSSSSSFIHPTRCHRRHRHHHHATHSMNMNTKEDIVVIGAGLPGLSTAFELAKTGIKVRLFTSSSKAHTPGSHAAAGMLAPDCEAITSRPMLHMCRLSRSLYPQFISSLHAIVPEINVNLTSTHPFLLTAPCNPSPDSRVVQLSTDQLRMIEPALNVDHAVKCIDDISIDAKQLTLALTAACDKLGVVISRNLPIHRIITDNNDLVSYVQTIDGQTIYADHFIITNGSWLRDLLPSIPIRPVKGQMLSLSCPPDYVIKNDMLRHVIYSEDCYIVPKFSNGASSVLPSCYYVGATVEDIGFDTNVTAGAISKLLNDAIKLIPSFEQYQIIHTWAGLRSTTPDLLPVLGITQYSNLSVASGFYRNGVLLSPIVGKLMCAVALGQTHSLPSNYKSFLQHFSPSRFTNPPPSAKEVKLFKILKDGTKEPILPPEGWKQKFYRPASLPTTEDESASPPTPHWAVPFSSSPSSLSNNNSTIPTTEDKSAPPPTPHRAVPFSSSPSLSSNNNVTKISLKDTPNDVEYSADVNDAESISAINDAYDDVLANRELTDVEEHEKLARAHNRAFGRTPSYLENREGVPVLSISDEEVKVFDKAFQQGINDMIQLESTFQSNDPSVLATKKDIEIIQTLDGSQDDGDTNGFEQQHIDGISTDGYY